MEEYEVIKIPVSDGTEKEFAIMNSFTVEDKKYIAVSLVEGDDITEGTYLYRYTVAGTRDIEVEQIEDMDEFEKVVEAYEKLV